MITYKKNHAVFCTLPQISKMNTRSYIIWLNLTSELLPTMTTSDFMDLVLRNYFEKLSGVFRINF